MYLKRILKEQINSRSVRRLKNDCKTFIEKNSSKLKKGNILYRGSKKSYEGIIKKDPRKRRSVEGDPFKTWLYEHFKPKKYPSREKMIPTQNGELNRLWKKRLGDVVGVFPIGNDFKLQYANEVSDFNSENPYFTTTTMSSFYFSMKSLPESYDLDEKDQRKVEELLDQYHESSPIRDEYDELKRVYNFMWQGLLDLSKKSDDVKEKVEEIKNNTKFYFDNSKLIQKIPSSTGLEINILAPSGFYYVKRDVLKEVIDEIF